MFHSARWRSSNKNSTASAVQLELHAICGGLMTIDVLSRDLATVYTFICVFTIFKLIAQAFVLYQFWQWLIPCVISGAEGNRALIFARFGFTRKSQIK